MKQTHKRIIAIAAVLLLAAGIIAFCSGRKLASGEIEGAPYPCTWEKMSSGNYKITITGELPDNAEWSILASPDVIEAKETGASAVFIVKPSGAGTGTLVLRMRESGLPVEKGADFSFGFYIDDDKKMSLSYGSAIAVEADAYESESGTAVYWKENGSGGLFIYLAGNDWRVESSEGVNRLGPTVSGDSARLEILPEKNAKGSLIVRNGESGEAFSFSFTAKDGVLSVDNCSAVKKESVEVPFKFTEPELQVYADEYIAAATDEQRDKIIDEYYAAKERLENEARIQEEIDLLAELAGRELTEEEIAAVKESVLGEN